MRDLLAFVRSVIGVAQSESITFLAAAVAYYAFVSIVPMVVLAIVVATMIGGVGFADSVVSILHRFLTPTAETAIRDALAAGPTSAGATVLSVIALLWSALKVFRGLDRAFSMVYGTTAVKGPVSGFRDAIVALTSIGFAVVLAAAVGVVLQGIAGPVGVVVGIAIVPGTLFLAFLPLYYLFPDVEMPFREAVPGAVTAALGWWLLASAFGLYAGIAGSASVYGVLGGALLLSTWLYFGAIVVILGAIVNATLGGRLPSFIDGVSTEGLPAEAAEAREDRQVQHPGPRQK